MGVKRTRLFALQMSAFDPKADLNESRWRRYIVFAILLLAVGSRRWRRHRSRSCRECASTRAGVASNGSQSRHSQNHRKISVRANRRKDPSDGGPSPMKALANKGYNPQAVLQTREGAAEAHHSYLQKQILRLSDDATIRCSCDRFTDSSISLKGSKHGQAYSQTSTITAALERRAAHDRRLFGNLHIPHLV
jgi:hypothetical protein